MDPLLLLHPLQQWWPQLYCAPLFYPIVVSFLLILFYFYVFKLATRTNPNFPPSPRKLPIIGNLHQLGRELHRSLQAISEKHGPLVLLHFCSVPTLIVSSAELAKEIMKSNDSVFHGRPRMKAADILFYGSSDLAFCPYGEYWRQVKKICVLELLSLRRVQAFQFVREEEVEDMINKIRVCCRNGDPVKLGEMSSTISYNIVSRSAIGRKYGEEDGKESFGDLAKRAMELIGAFNFEDLVPYLGWMDVLTGFQGRVRKTVKAFHSLVDEVIEEHQQSKHDNHSDKKDFADILLHLQNDDQFDINLTENNLKAILLDMFIGGTDTTGTTMEWAMAELVKNPILMKKTQEEIRKIVGNKSKLDQTDIDQMGYLKCVIKETLRLHAPVMITRESTSATKLEGFHIPPKTRVLINAWAIQRDPNLWERPEEFVPERFENNPVDFRGQFDQFIPFGGGKRGCPGIAFAMAEIEFVLANLLYWFDWKLPPGETTESFDMNDAFLMVIRKKIPLRLVPVVHSC